MQKTLNLSNSHTMDVTVKKMALPKNKLAIIVKGEMGTEYCCVECPARYLDKDQLELHLVLHNKEYRFLCGICGTGLKRKEHLDRHLLGHRGVRPHVCPECGKGFKRKEHLNIHVSIHSGDKNQVCPLCQRSFYRKDHLQKHLQTHNKVFMEHNLFPLSDEQLMEVKQEVDDKLPFADGDGTMEIEEENKPNLDSNMLIDKSRERPYICLVCSKSYKRKDHLKLHSVTHLAKDKICSECGKGFHKEEQLLVHMNVHLRGSGMGDGRGDVKAPPPESHLDERTENQDNIMIPISNDLLVPRLSYESESRPHECPICHRRFKRKQHLKVHANVHMRNQQTTTIWCSLCSEGFLDNGQFESHQCLASQDGAIQDYYEDAYTDHNGQLEGPNEIQQEDINENDYPTEFVEMPEHQESCDEDPDQPPVTMSEQTDLPLPVPLAPPLPTPQRVYVCKYCNKPFKRKDHYKIHLHIHTGVKSFFCPDCGKGFYRKDHLKKHAPVHQRVAAKPKPKKIPDLFPISMFPRKKEVKPEITITAPSNTKLRVPLQIKVPYQVVMSLENGEQRAVTIDPQASGNLQVF